MSHSEAKKKEGEDRMKSAVGKRKEDVKKVPEVKATMVKARAKDTDTPKISPKKTLQGTSLASDVSQSQVAKGKGVDDAKRITKEKVSGKTARQLHYRLIQLAQKAPQASKARVEATKGADLLAREINTVKESEHVSTLSSKEAPGNVKSVTSLTAKGLYTAKGRKVKL